MDWRVFILLRILQCAKSGEQRQQIILKIQIIFGTRPYNEKTMQIGSKLLTILTNPAQEENAPGKNVFRENFISAILFSILKREMRKRNFPHCK
jgi:hypothetical protein